MGCASSTDKGVSSTQSSKTAPESATKTGNDVEDEYDNLDVKQVIEADAAPSNKYEPLIRSYCPAARIALIL